MLDALDPTLLFVALATFFLGGVIKGTIGFGLPLLAIPALTAVHSLPVALSIAIVPQIVTNVWQLWAFRHNRENTFLPRFLLLGAVGLLLGAWLLSWVPGAFLEIALGLLVISYLGLQATRPNLDVGPKTRLRRFAPAFGLVSGTVHGATGLSGLVGPPYFHALQLDRRVFVFCNTAMFALFSVMHVPTLMGLGLLQLSAIWMGFLALPAGFLGVWVGGKLGPRITSAAFSRIVIIILGVTALIPIINGVRDLWTG